MGFKSLLISIAFVSLSTIVLGACGSDSTSTPQAGSSSVVPTSTEIAPKPTVSQAATVQPSGALAQTTGTVLDNAIQRTQPDIENVKYGGTFKNFTSSDANNLDPREQAQSSGLLGILGWTNEKLIQFVPDPNSDYYLIVPGLAEGWDISSDVSTYTFKIRHGVMWQNISPVNGRELTADDVAFNLLRYGEPQSISRPVYGEIDNVKVIDRYTVSIHLKTPNAFAINDLFGRGEFVLPPELVTQSGGAIRDAMIGTGPFILKDWALRRGSTFVKNPNYWQKDSKGRALPYLDGIVQTYVTDIATLTAGFRTGQSDNLTGLGVTPETIIAVAKGMPDLRIYRSVGGPIGIAFDTRSAPFNDVRVRRAFSMTLDRAKIMETISPMTGWVLQGPIPWKLVSDEPFSYEKLGPYYQFNPNEARKLLEDAGFADGKIAISTPLTYAVPDYTPRTLIQQKMWKDAGIDVPIQSVDRASFGPAYYNRAPAKGVFYTFENTGDFSLNWFTQNKFKADAVQNSSYISDPEVQKLVTEVKVTTDPAKLRQFAKFLWDFDTQGVYNAWTPRENAFATYAGHLRNHSLRNGGGFAGAVVWYWLSDAPRTAP